MKRILMAAVGVLSLSAAALAQDVVRLRSGVEMKGKVSALTSKNVIIVEAGNKSSALKAEDVASVTLGEPPPSLLKAEQAVGQGQFDNRTMNLFMSALEEIGQKKARDFHKQYVFMSWAQALQAKQSTQEALDTLKRLRSECGADCFLRAESWRRSKEIAKQKGQELYESVLKEMKDEPDPVGSEAELEMAKIKYERGDYEAAQALFGRLVASGLSAAREARLYQLRCLRQLKKQDELLALCKKILDDRQNNPPSLLQAAAASTAENQLPKVDKDKAKVREVLMTCLQAIAMGPPAGKEESEDYAVALITGAKCYIILSRDLDKPDAKEDYRNRALAYLKEVRGAYKGTRWADTANKEILAIEGDKPKEVPK